MTAALDEYIKQDRLFGSAGLLVSSASHRCLLLAVEKNIDGEDMEMSDPNDIPIFSPDRATEISTFVHQLLFASAVDNFNTYLSSLLIEILEKDPRPISGRNFPIKEILQFNDIDELKRRVVERYVLDLGYQNINDLSDLIQKNFGLNSMSHWLTKKRLERYIQIRNVICHNRGVANKTYLHKSGSKMDREGELVFVQHPVHPSSFFQRLVEKLDEEAMGKFQL